MRASLFPSFHQNSPKSLRCCRNSKVKKLKFQLKRRVQGVSFPRSGHHMLTGFLARYFGSSFAYCEYYNDCRRRPCVNPRNNLQKSHDQKLRLATDKDCDYLLQFRHPLYSICSNYRLHLKHKKSKYQGCRVGQEPIDRWRKFAQRDIQRWKKFVRKWAIENSNARAMTVLYEDVMEDPVGEFARVVEFMCPSHEPDFAKIAAFDAAPRKKLEDFPHFEPEFFRAIEDEAREEIQSLGYPLVMRDFDAPPLVPPRHAAA